MADYPKRPTAQPQQPPPQSQQQGPQKARLMKDCVQPKRAYDHEKDYPTLPRFAADFGRKREGNS